MEEKTYTVTSKALFETMMRFNRMSDDEVAELIGVSHEEFNELAEEDGYVVVEALLNKHHS